MLNRSQYDYWSLTLCELDMSSGPSKPRKVKVYNKKMGRDTKVSNFILPFISAIIASCTKSTLDKNYYHIIFSFFSKMFKDTGYSVLFCFEWKHTSLCDAHTLTCSWNNHTQVPAGSAAAAQCTRNVNESPPRCIIIINFFCIKRNR